MLSRIPDKEDDGDVDALGPLILAGILNTVNGPIIAGTIVLNVMQEDSRFEGGTSGAACCGKPGPSAKLLMSYPNWCSRPAFPGSSISGNCGHLGFMKREANIVT